MVELVKHGQDKGGLLKSYVTSLNASVLKDVWFKKFFQYD